MTIWAALRLKESSPPHQEFHARYHMVTPDYFRALGIPLLQGRFFTKADNTQAQKR